MGKITMLVDEGAMEKILGLLRELALLRCMNLTEDSLEALAELESAYKQNVEAFQTSLRQKIDDAKKRLEPK